MTSEAELKAARRDLLRRRPHMPEAARNNASELIEQTRHLIRCPDDAERLRPWVAASTRRLHEALSTPSTEQK